MTEDSRQSCPTCGQDWQTWYRVRADGRVFLLCPECDSIWLSGDDRRERARRFLPDLFPPHQQYDAWTLIEPAGPPG